MSKKLDISKGLIPDPLANFNCRDLADDLGFTIRVVETKLIRNDINDQQALEMLLRGCMDFVRTHSKIDKKMECPTCQGDGAIYEKRNLATRDK